MTQTSKYRYFSHETGKKEAQNMLCTMWSGKVMIQGKAI